MQRLIAELQRLYFLPDQRWAIRLPGEEGGQPRPDGEAITPDIIAAGLAGGPAAALDLAGRDGRVRALVLGFRKAADWEHVAALLQGVQDDLELPAPALSVSGHSGVSLWFSLAAPVPEEQAAAFLQGLRRKYLAGLSPRHLECHPAGDTGAADLVDLPPARHGQGGKWSAFVDPSMGGMFVDGPWLEMAPNTDRQADILAGLASIKPADFQRAQALIQPAPPEDAAPQAQDTPTVPATPPAGRPRKTLAVGGGFSDPRSFLLAVMNDPSASAGQRIRAAKALLPWFEPPRR